MIELSENGLGRFCSQKEKLGESVSGIVGQVSEYVTSCTFQFTQIRFGCFIIVHFLFK